MIKKAEEKDYPLLLQLWEETDGVRVRSDEDTLEGYLRILYKNSNYCYVAYDREKLIGSILCGYDGKRCYIYHMAVHSQYRNQSIAKNMLGMVAQQLKNTGISKFSFVVLKSNIAGNNFWNRIGAVKRNDLYYYDLSLDDIIKSINIKK